MGGKKDKSKLTPKKITVTRNNKTFETTVYVSSDKNVDKHGIRHRPKMRKKEVENSKITVPKGAKLSKSESRKRAMTIGRVLPNEHLIAEAMRCDILDDVSKDSNINRMRVLMKIRDKLEKGEAIKYHTKHTDYLNDVLNNDFDIGFDVELRDELNEIIIEDIGGKQVTRDDFGEVTELENKLFDFMEREHIGLVLTDDNHSPLSILTCESPFVSGSGAVIQVNHEYLKNNKGDLRIIGLAHELGHYADYRFNAKFDGDAFNSGSTMGAEQIAWRYGAEMLTAIGFDNVDGISVSKHDALYTYAHRNSLILENCIKKEDTTIAMREAEEKNIADKYKQKDNHDYLL